jgi:hypothetical protein
MQNAENVPFGGGFNICLHLHSEFCIILHSELRAGEVFISLPDRYASDIITLGRAAVSRLGEARWSARRRGSARRDDNANKSRGARGAVHARLPSPE